MKKYFAILTTTLFSFPVIAEGYYGGGLLYYVYIIPAVIFILSLMIAGYLFYKSPKNRSLWHSVQLIIVINALPVLLLLLMLFFV